MGMNVFVTKADGTRQLFDKKKIIKTCLVMGATGEVGEEIANKIEMQIYDGIETSKILQMIFRLSRRYKTRGRHLICLRKSLSLLNPKPDFERFIQILLGEHGYEVTPNTIVKGRCVEHEVDAIVRKNGLTYMVEVKHHFNFHTYTGLDESRIAWAVLEDVAEGFELGLNDFKINKAMIVCNTKFSEHAKMYAKCKGIHLIGWSSPIDHGLQTLIEEKKMYPITCIRGLKTSVRNKLLNAGIILLRQLMEKSPKAFEKETGITEETLKPIIKNAKIILQT
jgi:hypothetical protein